MRRGVLFLLVTISLFPMIAEAQWRGGRPAFAGRAPAVIARNPSIPIIRAVPPFAIWLPAGFERSPFGSAPGIHHSIFIAQPFGLYAPFFSPAPIYPAPIYAAPVAPVFPAPIAIVPAYTELAEPSLAGRNEKLAYEVHRLTLEVEKLRREQALRQSQQIPTEPATPASINPTVLVFRDGHRQAILNYAIVGQILWVLDEQTSMKIPLSDLDLPTTQKENPRFHVSEQ